MICYQRFYLVALATVLVSATATAQQQIDRYCPSEILMADGIHMVYLTVGITDAPTGDCSCALTQTVYHYKASSITVNTCMPGVCNCLETQLPIGSGGGDGVLEFNPKNAARAYFSNSASYDFWIQTDRGNIVRCFNLATSKGPVRFAYRSTISDPSKLPAWIQLSSHPTATETSTTITVNEGPGPIDYEYQVAN